MFHHMFVDLFMFYLFLNFEYVHQFCNVIVDHLFNLKLSGGGWAILSVMRVDDCL